MTKTESTLFALIDAILQMSDHAEQMGGAATRKGVAALHKLQTSIQKNAPRVVALLKELKADA